MARVYDLRTVICTVGAATISGYGEDDAIEFEWEGRLAEPTVGADGEVSYSRVNNRMLMATITLMATSKAIPLLLAAIEAQHGDNIGVPIPLLAPLPFTMIDPVLGDSVIGECVMVSRPAPSKGRDVGELTFELSLPSPKYTLGALNLL